MSASGGGDGGGGLQPDPAGRGGPCGPIRADQVAELRQWLLDQGATELALAEGECFSARDVAEKQGVDVGRVVQVFRRYGVTVTDVDLVRFTESDAVLVELSEEAGVVDSSDGQGLMRVVATALDRVAEAAVALYVQGAEVKLAQERASPLAFAQETARMTALAGKLGMGMGVLFRHHLRQAIDRQRVSQENVASRDLARMAIGFVDLVGSTAR